MFRLLPLLFLFHAQVFAANLESRIFCSALLSAVLTRAPIPSMLDEETRKAIYELNAFVKDRKLPAAETVETGDLMVVGDLSAQDRLAQVSGRIRAALDGYFREDETRVIGTIIHGRVQGLKFMNVVFALEEPLLREFAPQIREQDLTFWGSVGDERNSERQSQIWRFFALRDTPDRWLYVSQRHLVRASTIRTILDVRRLDDAAVKQELTNEAIVNGDNYLTRIFRMSDAIRRGQAVERHWKHLYGQAELQIDRLYRFDQNGEVSTVVLLQIRNLPERNFMSSDRGMAPARVRELVPAMGFATP